ncbi:MAG: hypothetical protein WAN97_00005, partial [Candidatus Acidiferrales bacterium]
ILSMYEFGGCDHSHAPARPKKCRRMYDEWRPRRAEFRKFYTSVKRALESIFSLLAVERLVSDERRIPNERVNWRNVSGSYCEEISLQKVRRGTDARTSQGPRVNIHTPDLRTRITEIMNPLCGGL